MASKFGVKKKCICTNTAVVVIIESEQNHRIAGDNGIYGNDSTDHNSDSGHGTVVADRNNYDSAYISQLHLL